MLFREISFGAVSRGRVLLCYSNWYQLALDFQCEFTFGHVFPVKSVNIKMSKRVFQSNSEQIIPMSLLLRIVRYYLTKGVAILTIIFTGTKANMLQAAHSSTRTKFISVQTYLCKNEIKVVFTLN